MRSACSWLEAPWFACQQSVCQLSGVLRAGGLSLPGEGADQFVQDAVEARGKIGADHGLDIAVGGLYARRHAGAERAAARRERNAHPPLIMIEALAFDVTKLVHARQHAGQTRARYPAQVADFAGLQRPGVDQGAHDAPLLLGDAVGIENGPEAGY